MHVGPRLTFRGPVRYRLRCAAELEPIIAVSARRTLKGPRLARLELVCGTSDTMLKKR